MKSQVSIALITLLLSTLAAAAEHTRAGAAASAAAPTPKGGCIVLATAAEQEQSVTAADGTSSKTFVPASRAIPGAEIVWSTTARNVCAKPADNVVINQPVPEHMEFVADSAIGGGAQITLSVDGRDFLPAGQLTARNTDGSARPARATDVRFVRWTLNSAIAPQNEFAARFRAVLQ